MIEYIGWRVRLWLVGKRERVEWAAVQSNLRTTADWSTTSTFWRLVDWVSPFTRDGYKNRRLRRLLVTLRHPRRALRRDALWILRGLVIRLAPWVGPGRYEGNDYRSRLKAEWFDTHTDLAQDTTGDSDDFGLWVALFDLTPPWSLRPEAWLLTTDTQGFVDAERFVSWEAAWARFSAISSEYSRWFSSLEPDPYDVYGTPEHEALLIAEENGR